MQEKEYHEGQLVDVEYGQLIMLPVYLWLIVVVCWLIVYIGEGNY